MHVFVLDKKGHPLMPTHPARARKLLRQGRARVHRRVPFTIRLIDRTASESETQPVRVKLDPGARVAGIALVREAGETQHVLWRAELEHRGEKVRKAMNQRRTFRRARRARKTRHRQPRFNNRRRSDGWLPPSARSRVANVRGWTERLCRWAPVTAATVETVRFDTQAIRNPEISGTDYQNGPLAGWETWAYLLHRDGHRCVYCDAAGVPLERDHVVPRSRGGSDRVGNLVVSCRSCNEAKGNQDLTTFLADRPQRRRRIAAKLDAPLNDAAAVNVTRKALPAMLRAMNLPVEAASGGRTRYNRKVNGLAKSHAVDAACAGRVGTVQLDRGPTLRIAATGRGSYQRTRLTGDGFPRGYLTRSKTVQGFRTGDLVRADVPAGRKAGAHTGRVAVRRTGSFNVQTPAGTVQGIPARTCTVLQRGDGYSYTYHLNQGRAAYPA